MYEVLATFSGFYRLPNEKQGEPLFILQAIKNGEETRLTKCMM